VPFEQDLVRLWVGETQVAEAGASMGVSDELIKQAAGSDTVSMRLDLGAGNVSATAWGCDLTEEYVRFNTDYVT
jgi:glutamate N-acetyltransferase/amino-acid N-acetyltransferase